MVPRYGLRRTFLILALIGGTPAASADDAPGKPTAVGVAKVDITPTGPIRLSGYLSRQKESSGVTTKLWAKAIAIGATDPVVLVSVDNLGVGENVVEEVARRLQASRGLPRARFAVASSHTHSAPCTTGVAPNIFGKPIAADEQSRIDAYTKFLTDAIERVSLNALAARVPSQLSWAEGRVDFAMNRRTKGGPVDHAMPALKATRASNGELLAVVVNYACHCTTLDPAENTINGDWAGYAQAALEADHPGAVALTVIGCGADANPTKRLAPKAAEEHGRAVAAEFQRLLKGSWTPLVGPPAVAFERFELPFDTLPTRDELEKLVKAGGAPAYNASVQLARLDRGEALQSRLPYSAQCWSFGDALAMVFLPGEVVVDYVLRIKSEFDPKRLWVTAYANDDPCYIPSERILKEGGYEASGAMVYYSRPTRLKPGVEQIIIDGVHKVVPASFRPPAKADAGRVPTPAESLAAIKLKPGFRAELVASEPLVQSPVAIDFGADGTLWVCEMRDYPTGIDGHWKAGGVVRRLRDTDGDGKYDAATEFIDGLPFPTGVMAWRKGVLICAAPEIIYAEDTDGDGKADVRRVLFRGFATENYQARVNGLAYGLDNWVYGANGLIGGSIRGTATGKNVDIGGRDFRIHPDTGEMEPASGLTQQGRVRDDWGNQFGGNNSVWVQHYPLPDHDARRNPYVAAPSPAVLLASDDDWSRLYPASETVARFNHPESANRVTSACSPLIYRDTLLGDEFYGNAFTCEPVHNLVHRDVLTPDGPTFTSRRAPDEADSEFLASTDPWFRPVQVRTGPDGALWVVDMTRAVIEHPRWVSPDLLATLDVRAGADRGRIYKVYHETRPPRAVPVLASLSTPDLARQIDGPNGTLRDNAQRLLVERGGTDAVPVLAEVAARGRHPAGRAQAIGALDGLHALDPATLIAAAADPHPGVRRIAARFSRAWLGKDPKVASAVTALADDPDPTVRFDAVLSLGDWNDPEAGRAIGRVAVRDADDPWTRAAVLSSARPHAAAVLAQVVSNADAQKTQLVEPLLATVVGSGDRAAIAGALSAVLKTPGGPETIAPWQFGAVAELLDAADGVQLGNDPRVAQFAKSASDRAASPKLAPADRVAASRLLGRVPDRAAADQDVLAAMLDSTEPAEVQSAAVRALLRSKNPEAVDAVLTRWNGFGPAVRSSSLDALLAREDSAEAVLKAVEASRIAAAAVDASHRQLLLKAGPGARKARAAEVFGKLGITPRAAVMTRFAPARELTGDLTRGKAVFARLCASCHKVGGLGHDVGPDLAALTETSVDALMTAILDPNREVDARYASYSAALKDGRVVTGLIAGETATGLTLKRQEGQTEVILRTDLEQLKSTGQSLMPEGLENDLKPAELADLMAYLARGVRTPKTLEGNRPETLAARPDGSVRLPASAAEVYGPSLTFETAHVNLGLWHNAQDYAAWTFRTETPNVYTVSMEWACADEFAGNPFAVTVSGITGRTAVAGTGAGTWANYRTIFVFEARLPAGTHRLEFRPVGQVKGALLDLRAVVLTPRSAGVFHAGPASK